MKFILMTIGAAVLAGIIIMGAKAALKSFKVKNDE